MRKKLKCGYCKAKTTVKYKEYKTGRIFKKTVHRVPEYHIKGGKNWAKKNRGLKEKALMRAYHTCQICGYPYDLHVHHKKPISKGGKDKLSNMQVLCSECHLKAHGKKNRRLDQWYFSE